MVLLAKMLSLNVIQDGLRSSCFSSCEVANVVGEQGRYGLNHKPMLLISSLRFWS